MKRRRFIKNTGLFIAGTASLSVMHKNGPELPMKIIPPALKIGDTIALTAPAGAVFNTQYIDKIEAKLKGLGFQVIKGKTLYAQEGFLAGTDKLRAEEIHSLFKNDAVKAIVAMRGGWGCGRILDLLNYDIIRANPKILMGYSDITSLLISIYEKTNLVTYHGPMGYSSWKSFSTGEVYKTLVAGKKNLLENPIEERTQLKTLVGGQETGELMGGNLTVICALIGTKHEPNWEGKLLFLEETGEEPYRVDRMLWQFKSAGVFEKVSGIILGSFRNCEPEEPKKSFSLQDIFDQHFLKLSIPVYMGASFGHTINKFTLPIGILAEIDADAHTIQLLENPTIFNG